MSNITPITGWLLNAVAEIDLERPGLIGHVLRCTPERRHTIAAYLSVERPAMSFETVADLGAFLCGERHEAILNAAWPIVPVGLRGALARAGDQPHPRRFYGYLHGLLCDGSRPEARILVSQLTRVDPLHLQIARSLPQQARTARLVEAIGDRAIADDITSFVTAATAAGADRDAMVAALRDAANVEAVRSWAKRWALRLRFPESPVPPAQGYAPILCAADLKAAALRFRNCMVSYIANIMEERSSFAIVTHEGDEAIVHLAYEQEQWLIDDVYGMSNSNPSKSVRDQAERYLAEHGIRYGRSRRPLDRPWSSLRRLSRVMEF